MASIDSVQRVLCPLIIGTSGLFDRDNGNIVYQDIDGWSGYISLVHDVDVLAAGKVSDDEDGRIGVGGEFFFDLEPAVLQVGSGGICEGKIVAGLQDRVALYKNKTGSKP